MSTDTNERFILVDFDGGRKTLSETKLRAKVDALGLPGPMADELTAAIFAGVERRPIDARDFDGPWQIRGWELREHTLPTGKRFVCTREARAVVYFYWIAFACEGGARIEIGEGEGCSEHAGAGEVRVVSIDPNVWIDFGEGGARKRDSESHGGSGPVSLPDAERAEKILESIYEHADLCADWTLVIARNSEVYQSSISQTRYTRVPKDVYKKLKLGDFGGVMWCDARGFPNRDELDGCFVLMSDEKWCDLFNGPASEPEAEPEKESE